MGKLISDSPTTKMTDTRSSAKQNTSVGSGSRPVPSKFKIPTSAPMQPHELDRAPKGWLK